MRFDDVQNATIIIVDDNPIMLQPLAECFRQRGLSITFVETAAELFEELQEQLPDLIMLDIFMPVKSGFDVCRQLKRDELTKDIPIIFMSALDETVDKIKGFEIGGVDYITKPFEHEEVFARMAAHLRLRKLQKHLIANNLQLQQEIAQRIQTEEALRESEERFRGLAEATFEGIIVHDKGTILDMNQIMEEMFGYARAELIGANALDLMMTEYEEGILGNIRSEYENLTEGEGKRKDGSRFPVELKAKAMPYQGRSVRITAIRDLTERKCAEHALRESEERFRTIFEHAPVMINSYHAQGQYVMWNHECEKRLGYPKEEIMACADPLALLYPEPHLHHQVIADMAKADGNFREYNVTNQRGALLVQLWAYFRLPSGLVISVGHDMTERKQAENALLESQQYTRNIINSSLDMIITVDRERRIVEFNQAAQRVFGYQPEEVVGQSVDLLYAAPAESTTVHQLMVEQGQIVREVLNRRKNGAEFPCILSASTLRDVSGEPVGYMGISRDITATKQAQADLVAAHHELQQKNLLLHEMNASKDKFFSIISHDLKNPLSILLGFAELLHLNIDRYEHDRIKTMIAKVLDAAERLRTLLENLLTWSRMQRGLLECAPENINVTELVDENIALLMLEAERKQITLHNTLPTYTPAYADQSMVTTILRNLMTNALKFTTTGGRVTITCHNHETMPYQEIAVIDTGIGIPAHVLPQLLRLDTQYTQTGTAGEKGTGLGLILCKELVEKHGGQLWIESELGHGATFRFTLPKSRRLTS